MKLSAQCFTVRHEIEKDLWGTMAALRGFGLNYVEIGSTYGVPPGEFKERIDRIGLKVSGSHPSIDRLEADIDAVISESHILELPCVVLSSVGKARWERGWAVVAKELEQIGAKLRDAGLLFAYHNHAFEFDLENGKPGFDILYETADPHLVTAQVDTYWVAYGGADPATTIRKLKGRVPQVHVKDGRLGKGKPRFLEVGQGDLDWDGILAACRDGDVEFVSIEQDDCARPPLESVRMSIEFLRGKSISE